MTVCFYVTLNYFAYRFAKDNFKYYERYPNSFHKLRISVIILCCSVVKQAVPVTRFISQRGHIFKIGNSCPNSHQIFEWLCSMLGIYTCILPIGRFSDLYDHNVDTEVKVRNVQWLRPRLGPLCCTHTHSGHALIWIFTDRHTSRIFKVPVECYSS